MAKAEKSRPTPDKSAGRVFDVRRPGKAMAPPTSRPVVIGHKPEAQNAQAAVSGIGSPEQPLLAKRKIIQVLPSGETDKTEKAAKPNDEAVVAPEPTPEEAAPTQPAIEQKEATETVTVKIAGPPAIPAGKQLAAPEGKEEPSAQPAVSEDEPDETESIKAPETSEPVSAEADQPSRTSAPEASVTGVSETAQDAAPTAEEESKPEPAIEPLFDESGIIVSNHEHHRGHHSLKVFVLLILILVLAAAAFDIALDAGLLTIDGLPHTDLL